MPDADTAVLEPETIVEAPETETPEGELNTAVETSETDGSEETPETEAPISAAEVAVRIEAARKEAIEAVQAEAKETQDKAAYQWRQSRASQLRNGEAQKRIADLASWAHNQGEEGKDLRLNPQVVGPLAQEIEGMVFQEQHDLYVGSFDAFLAKTYPEYRPSKEVASMIERAARSGIPDNMVVSQHAKFVEAVRSELEPRLRKEIEADLKSKNGAAGKTAALRDADATRRAGGRPTAAGDAGGSSGRKSFSTQQQVDMALYKGEINSATARQWLAKGLPYS